MLLTIGMRNIPQYQLKQRNKWKIIVTPLRLLDSPFVYVTDNSYDNSDQIKQGEKAV